jgi:hypothetical protein
MGNLIQTVNMDNQTDKRLVMSFVGTLRGLWDVSLKQRKKKRTLDQNSYYHIAVVEPFLAWLREEWGDDSITHEEAHEVLRNRILGYRERGEIQIPNSTTRLDTKEFSDYVENCSRWLAEFANVVVIPSDLFYEGATSGTKRQT